MKVHANFSFIAAGIALSFLTMSCLAFGPANVLQRSPKRILLEIVEGDVVCKITATMQLNAQARGSLNKVLSMTENDRFEYNLVDGEEITFNIVSANKRNAKIRINDYGNVYFRDIEAKYPLGVFITVVNK